MWSNCANIVNTASGKCLEVYDGNYTNGQEVHVWRCDGTDEQEWNFTWDGHIEHLDSGKVLDTHAGISIYRNDGTDTQYWTYENGYIRNGSDYLEMFSNDNGADVFMGARRGMFDTYLNDQMWSVVAC